MRRLFLASIIILSIFSAGYAATLQQMQNGVIALKRAAGGSDTTDPTVTITNPTSSATYDNGSTSSIDIGGSASDNVAVSSVAWACPTCTPDSGSCSGTTSWTASGIGLASGDNVITVTATDSSSNTGNDILTVTYTPAGGGQNFADTFDRTNGALAGSTSSGGQTWAASTVVGDISISGNVAQATAVSYQDQAIAMVDQTDTTQQYACAVISPGAIQYNGMGNMLRYGSTSGDWYAVYASSNDNIIEWDLFSGSSFTTEIGSVSAPVSDGDKICYTINNGTGASTTVNIWVNPVNSSPHDVDNWDGSSDPPDYTINGTADCDADNGKQVGIMSYTQSTSVWPTWDNFTGGDAP